MYEARIGDTSDAEAVAGYWTFLAGFGMGIAGVVVYFLTDAATMGRGVGYAMAALAPALLMAGAVLQFPLRKKATYLTGLGVVITLASMGWFLVLYPSGWSRTTGNAGVTVAYIAGLMAIGIAGVTVPQTAPQETEGGDRSVDDGSGSSAQETPAAEPERAQAELDALETETERAEAELDDLEAKRDRVAMERDELEDERKRAEAELEELQTRTERAEAELAEAEETAVDTEGEAAFHAAQLRSLESSQSQFELYEDRGGEWRWRLRHRNGNLIAGGGEGYTRKESAQNGIQAVRRDALGATVLLVESEEDLPDEASREGFVFPDTTDSRAVFELYADAGDEHRWRLRHENGNIIASSGEGYASSGGAEHAIEGIREYVGPAEYLEADPRAIEIYGDDGGEWRWRLVHRNGTILADSGAGYYDRSGARRAVDQLREEIDEAEIEVFEDAAGEYRWRLLGGNDGVMAESAEGYASEGGAEDAVEDVRANLPSADLLDIGAAVFEVYEDQGTEWRWRLRHRNGQILAVSGEGYSDRSGAWAGIESVKRNAPNAGRAEH